MALQDIVNREKTWDCVVTPHGHFFATSVKKKELGIKLKNAVGIPPSLYFSFNFTIPHAMYLNYRYYESIFLPSFELIYPIPSHYTPLLIQHLMQPFLDANS